MKPDPPGLVSMPRAQARQMRSHSREAARLLRALANPQRLEILCLLAEGEMPVAALNERLSLSQSALSQHLAVLRAEGIVGTRREAQSIHYSLLPGPAARLMDTLHGIFCAAPAPHADGPARRRRA